MVAIALASFFLFLSLSISLTGYLKKKSSEEKLDLLSLGFGFLMWGMMILSYFVFISRNQWTLFFLLFLSGLEFFLSLCYYLEKRRADKDTHSMVLSLSTIPFLFLFYYFYTNDGGILLLAASGFFVYFGSIGILSFLMHSFKLQERLDRTMQKDITVYFLFLSSALLIYFLIFETFLNLPWVIGVFLFQKFLSYVLKKTGSDPEENPQYHGFVSWFLTFLLSTAGYFFLQESFLLFPLGISLVLTIYYLFRYRQA